MNLNQEKLRFLASKEISTPIALTIIISLVVLVGGGVLYVKYNYDVSSSISTLKEKDETSNWKTHTNEGFGYSISYPDEKYIPDMVDNPVIESETRDIGQLELKDEYWEEYSDLIKNESNPKIFWIVNKEDRPKNSECRTYSEYFDLREQTIRGKTFTVLETKSSDDVGMGGSYYKEYNYKGKSVCVLLGTSISLKDYKSDISQLSSLQQILEEVVETFKIEEQDKTANWKTYRNEKYKFEFKYPQAFHIDDSFEWSYFNSIFGKEAYRFKFREKAYSEEAPISIIMAPTKKDVLGNIKDKKTGDSSSSNIYKDYTNEILYTLTKTYERDRLEVNDMSWDIIKIDYDGGSYHHEGRTFSISFYLNKNGLTYILECNDYNYPDYKSDYHKVLSEDIESLCYKTASSFVFLNKEGVSRWGLYRNKEYGFEFEYPINTMNILEEPDILDGTNNSFKKFTSGLNVSVFNDNLDEEAIHKYDPYPVIGENRDVTYEISIGGRQGYGFNLVSATNYKTIGFMVPIDDNHYLEISENSKWPSVGEDWDRIISTFKFID